MSSMHLISLAQHALPMRSTMWHVKLTWGVFMAAMVDQTADALILSSHLICLHTDFCEGERQAQVPCAVSAWQVGLHLRAAVSHAAVSTAVIGWPARLAVAAMHVVLVAVVVVRACGGRR